jgi:hypothetical protein
MRPNTVNSGLLAAVIKGCGLVLQHNGITDHVCIKALQTHTNYLQSKIANQDHNLKKTTMRFGKREKSVLSQIACLQNEIQMQALKYQKGMNEAKAEIDTLVHWQHKKR